jgi:hypothetical protein
MDGHQNSPWTATTVPENLLVSVTRLVMMDLDNMSIDTKEVTYVNKGESNGNTGGI